LPTPAKVPRTPAELKDALAAIFPGLPRDFGAAGESVFEEASSTFPSVLREFAQYFARDIDQFPDRQLRKLSELVARSTASPGPLQDAMHTCFVQRLGELRADTRFAPFLAAAGKP
jgi:hypothetical protein